MSSIRTRLLLGLLALIAVVSLLAGVLTYRRVLAETSILFDYQLRQMALSLRDQAAIAPRIELPADSGDADFVIQIWNPFGARVYLSRPGLPLLDRAVIGFTDSTLQGARWRIYSLQTDDGVIQVAQPWRVRENLAGASALRVVVPLLLFLPLMAAAIGWIVSRGLAPLTRVASEVKQRDVHSLYPIDVPRLPREVAPLIEELNRLLARLAEAFGAQRAFVADAAHELRSPLTALSLQLQLLDRAPERQARDDAREKLGAAVDRAIHLAEQLLTLARNEPQGAAAPFSSVSLEAVARESIGDVHALAVARGIDLGLETTASPAVMGDKDALRILVRNLTDNAVRYTPTGGRVQLRVSASIDGGALLHVEDSGPGIAPEERVRAFDRFYRRADSAEGGSGLGLAIVKAIADRHLAQVTLGDARPHGLCVTVAFPPAKNDS